MFRQEFERSSRTAGSVVVQYIVGDLFRQSEIEVQRICQVRLLPSARWNCQPHLPARSSAPLKGFGDEFNFKSYGRSWWGACSDIVKQKTPKHQACGFGP